MSHLKHENVDDIHLYLRIFKSYVERKRDIGLEQDLITRNSADAACLYAFHVIKGEWKEAEHIITKVPAYSRRSAESNMLDFPKRDGTGLIANHNLLDVMKHFESIGGLVGQHFISSGLGKRLIKHKESMISKVYTKLTGKRYVNFEKNTKIEHSWLANRVMGYVKIVYSVTKEIADFENGLVAVNIINEIKENTFSKKPIPFDEKERIIKELEQRMTLYSFTAGQSSSDGAIRNRGRRRRDSMSAIKNYFDTRVEAMNELMKILNEHDENMTILELKKFIRNETV